jgi:molybdopterin-biosynthesis enzyme MoeA-like protein
LKRVETIPDDYDTITETIRRLSSQHDVIFTSGGIGPTHDDITYSALAKAYNLPLKLDVETCNKMEEMSKDRYPHWTLTEARKRMALFPDPCDILRKSTDLWVPVVVVNKNIHVLPGIPRLFEGLLDSLKPHFKELVHQKLGDVDNSQYYRVQVGTALGEGDIAGFLGELQDRVNDQSIKIGSYPNWKLGHDGSRVVVSVVGKDEKLVQSVGDEVVKGIKGWITAGKHHNQ